MSISMTHPEITDPEYHHVIPIDDLREHISYTHCWCNPTQDEEEPLVWLHHSMDRREHTVEKGILH